MQSEIEKQIVARSPVTLTRGGCCWAHRLLRRLCHRDHRSYLVPDALRALWYLSGIWRAPLTISGTLVHLRLGLPRAIGGMSSPPFTPSLISSCARNFATLPVWSNLVRNSSGSVACATKYFPHKACTLFHPLWTLSIIGRLTVRMSPLLVYVTRAVGRPLPFIVVHLAPRNRGSIATICTTWSSR